jgi:hypothetical protein
LFEAMAKNETHKIGAAGVPRRVRVAQMTLEERPAAPVPRAASPCDGE